MNMHRDRRRRLARLALLIVPLMVIVFALLVWAVYGLWNSLMPDIFGLRAITYWQALGLMLLSWILFGGLRGARSGGRWRHGMRERWERMSPAEREEFVKGLHTRCGGATATEPGPKD
jgi:hypothetical protein